MGNIISYWSSLGFRISKQGIPQITCNLHQPLMKKQTAYWRQLAVTKQGQDGIMGQGPLVLQFTTLARTIGYIQETRKLTSPDTVYFPTKNRYPCHDKAGVPWNPYLPATDPTHLSNNTQTDYLISVRISEWVPHTQVKRHKQDRCFWLPKTSRRV